MGEVYQGHHQWVALFQSERMGMIPGAVRTAKSNIREETNIARFRVYYVGRIPTGPETAEKD